MERKRSKPVKVTSGDGRAPKTVPEVDREWVTGRRVRNGMARRPSEWANLPRVNAHGAVVAGVVVPRPSARGARRSCSAEERKCLKHTGESNGRKILDSRTSPLLAGECFSQLTRHLGYQTLKRIKGRLVGS